MPKPRSSVIKWLDAKVCRSFPSAVTRLFGCSRRASDRNQRSNSSNILVRQPIEIILMVAGFLTPASKMLLSLSSKHLRAVLTNRYDLSFPDQYQKLVFLLLLERDLPEYLTCHSCASIFHWPSRRKSHYRCPRYNSQWRSHNSMAFHCAHHNQWISREEADLMLRAYYRGPSHGLPETYLDHECNHKEIFRCRRGRMVNGNLIVANSRISTCPFEFGQLYLAFTTELCGHIVRRLIIQCRESIRSLKHDRYAAFELKCEHCATDIRIRFRMLADNKVQMEQRFWQKYGFRSSYVARTTSNFRLTCHAMQDDGDLSSRNLEYDFDSVECPELGSGGKIMGAAGKAVTVAPQTTNSLAGTRETTRSGTVSNHVVARSRIQSGL